MNYYEHHIRDYDADTAHLTWLEDMAYTRLLRLYYRKESPIPADIQQVCRLVRAHSKAEKRAVEQVLREFFELRDDGWRHDRCDEEIAAYQARAERARASGKLGGRPTRKDADEAQETQAQEPTSEPAQNPAGSATKPTENPTGFQTETQTKAHQTPDTRHQTPEEINTLTADSTEVGVCGGGGGGGPPNATPAGLVCKAMKAVGIADVNPGHPELLALLEAGATQAEFVGAAEEAARRHKGFAYALGMVKRQRQEAAKVKRSVHHGPLPASDDPRARQLETAALMTGRVKPGTLHTQETIDVAARVIPA